MRLHGLSYFYYDSGGMVQYVCICDREFSYTEELNDHILPLPLSEGDIQSCKHFNQTFGRCPYGLEYPPCETKCAIK